MKPKSYSDDGFVLARKNYGEADRILSVFSKNHGRVSLLAKGVRRLSSKKRGHVEIFNEMSFLAAKGRGLELMTEAQLLNSHGDIKKDLKKVAVAYFFMEAIGRTTHEGEPHREIYELLHKSFEDLRGGTQLKGLRAVFTRSLLITLGFWPGERPLTNPDAKLSEIIERNLATIRVGKKLLE